MRQRLFVCAPYIKKVSCSGTYRYLYGAIWILLACKKYPIGSVGAEEEVWERRVRAAGPIWVQECDRRGLWWEGERRWYWARRGAGWG